MNIAADIDDKLGAKLHDHLAEVRRKTGKRFTLKAWIESCIDKIGRKSK